MSIDPLDIKTMRTLRKELAEPPVLSLSDMIKSDQGRTPVATLFRAFLARLAPGKLSAGEYAIYGAGDVPMDVLRKFVGVRIQNRLHAMCNDESWFAITKNKLLFEAAVRGIGLAVPETVAAYDRKGRGAGTQILASREELERFLSKMGNTPLFCKPLTGVNSLGTFRLNSVRAGIADLNDGIQKPMNQVVDFICEYSAKGYLFQKPLEPDLKVVRGIGENGLVSIRFFILLSGGKPQIEACLVKLPGPGETADNFWREGAIVCGIDPATGKIYRAVANRAHRADLIDSHPSSGTRLSGVKLPGYDAAMKAVMRAAPLLSGIATQSWDVALTNRGPVLLEVNFGGDLKLVQTATGTGLFTETYCRHLRQCGYTGSLPN